MTSVHAKDKKRLIQLDILRGIAILLVLGRHSPLHSRQAGLLRPLVGVWNRVGWTGVDLFFVLSGFLIGGLLFHEMRSRSHLDVRRFIIRRGLKIWPSYYLSVLVGSLIVFFLVGRDFGRAAGQLWPNFLHIQNYFMRPNSPMLRVLGPTWSLAVEEHFYLLLPLLLSFLGLRRWVRRDSIPAIPLLACLIIVTCTGMRLFLQQYRSADMSWVLETHLRIDGLCFGVFLAYLYHYKPDFVPAVSRRRGLLLLIGLALLSPFPFTRNEHFINSIGLTLLYLGYGCILLSVVTTPVGSPGLGKLFATVPARLLAGIGFFSYTIYLWHVMFAVMPMEYLLARGFRVGPPILTWLCGLLLYLTAAIGAGIAAGKLVDSPTLKLRDRLFPARADALSDVPPIPVEAAPGRRIGLVLEKEG